MGLYSAINIRFGSARLIRRVQVGENEQWVGGGGEGRGGGGGDCSFIIMIRTLINEDCQQIRSQINSDKLVRISEESVVINQLRVKCEYNKVMLVLCRL